jgi:hypothetical protein
MYSGWRAKKVLAAAVLAILPAFGLQAVTVRAQAPGGPAASNPASQKIYTSKTVFHLPIKIDDRLRGDLREVCLYVKDGVGEWQRKDSVPPTQTHFTFRVPHDGEYWFSVVTVDKSGRMTPPDVSKEPPGLMVVVDTRTKETPPATPATAPATPVLPAAPQTSIPAAPAATVPAPTVPAATVPAAAPVIPPVAPVVPTAVQPAPASSVITVGHSGNSLVMPTAAAPVAGGSHSNRQLINTTRASIDYRIDQVGPSGVGKVEVWLTADDGHTWQRFGEDADHRSPAEINLPGEGVFGIRLVVTNGNGFGGKAPVSGDAPSSTLEVDMTRPFAQLREIEPVGSNGTIDIRWTASDKNLGTEPVNLYYAPGREGPWLPIATNLKNDGLYRWTFPRNGVSQFLVRLEVADQAGNTTRCDTQSPVVLDTTEPQVQVIGVNGVQAGAMAPHAN